MNVITIFVTIIVMTIICVMDILDIVLTIYNAKQDDEREDHNSFNDERKE